MGGLARDPAPAAPEDVDHSLSILRLERRFQRERAARLHAEQIAEEGLRDLYERQRQIALLGRIATVANECRSVNQALAQAIRAICEHTGWGLGNAYLLSPSDLETLAAVGIWHASDPERAAPFIAVTDSTPFARGVGLPGRVLAGGQAIWIRDVANEPSFPRAPAARDCGLHAAFALPILVGAKVEGVLEFFHREVMPPDEGLLALANQIGAQLGRVVERTRAEQQLLHDASHDVLTGLPNRLLFTDRLERAIAARRRRPELGFAVLFVDLDRFKLVNDSMGHAAGDALLREIAGRFLGVIEQARGADGTTLMATLARLGGDEFTILIEDSGGERLALELAEALQDSLRQPFRIEGQEIFASASVGLASCADGYASAAEIMRDADLAMYRAKAGGRARVEVFNQGLHEEAKRRLALETDLRNALRNREFVLHYQPIMALEGERLVGFEALLRWRRPGGLIVPPADFIDVAEEAGLIVPIGAWVMVEAFSKAARWQAEHVDAGPLSMSVNVSPRQFLQPDFVEQVIGAIEASGAPPTSLRLEITESVTVQDAERTRVILQALRALGVRVSIDDFGTGYSSLSYLQTLPFDTLKIDRSFVRALKETGGQEIVRAILDLARNLGMEVVAEGAETASHVDQLRAMGCGFAQGFYFSRPMEASAVDAMLRDLSAKAAA